MGNFVTLSPLWVLSYTTLFSDHMNTLSPKESSYLSKVPFHCQSCVWLKIEWIYTLSYQTKVMSSFTHFHMPSLPCIVCPTLQDKSSLTSSIEECYVMPFQIFGPWSLIQNHPLVLMNPSPIRNSKVEQPQTNNLSDFGWVERQYNQIDIFPW